MASIRRRRGRVEMKLNEEERRVLLSVVDTLSDVLGTVPRTTPKAFDDEELQAEYRKWVVPELETTRRADIDAIRRGLTGDEEHTELTDTQALSWIRALNHLRLAAAGVLGIDEDGWEERQAATVLERDEYRMLHTLGWVQEALVDALDS